MGPAKNLVPPQFQGNIEFGTFLDRLNDLERRVSSLEEGASSYEAIAGPLGQGPDKDLVINKCNVCNCTWLPAEAIGPFAACPGCGSHSRKEL